jgi:hypothetical protein
MGGDKIMGGVTENLYNPTLSQLLKLVGSPKKQYKINVGTGDEPDLMTVSRYAGMKTRMPVDPMSYLVRKALGLHETLRPRWRR